MRSQSVASIYSTLIQSGSPAYSQKSSHVILGSPMQIHAPKQSHPYLSWLQRFGPPGQRKTNTLNQNGRLKRLEELEKLEEEIKIEQERHRLLLQLYREEWKQSKKSGLSEYDSFGNPEHSQRSHHHHQQSYDPTSSPLHYHQRSDIRPKSALQQRNRNSTWIDNDNNEFKVEANIEKILGNPIPLGQLEQSLRSGMYVQEYKIRKPRVADRSME
ncbi:MAG: hypothetical protein EZS28_021837 [Streblomastix strix]|uniref:Uncharacterized protein n=1 Tax=Streblomastix strix TaxID=222440 RepID=A0A5J4VJM7_9EUKA|nr:MAG: hypothetical protein EZS28_021837 [Streblomastix strix]